MKSHSFRHAFLLAGWIAASAAFAGPDIVKCTDSAGHITLTDEPCREGTETVMVPASAIPPAAEDGEHALAVTRIVSAERVTAPPPAPRAADTWARKATPERMLARDVATLKAARASMLQQDNAARHTRLAGLN
jgi:hypothetical protein